LWIECYIANPCLGWVGLAVFANSSDLVVCRSLGIGLSVYSLYFSRFSQIIYDGVFIFGTQSHIFDIFPDPLLSHLTFVVFVLLQFRYNIIQYPIFHTSRFLGFDDEIGDLFNVLAILVLDNIPMLIPDFAYDFVDAIDSGPSMPRLECLDRRSTLWIQAQCSAQRFGACLDHVHESDHLAPESLFQGRAIFPSLYFHPPPPI